MDQMMMYVIYEHSIDYPDKYVVRMFNGETPTTIGSIHDTLAEAREAIPPGLVCIPRWDNDEPQIVEVWL